MQTDLLEWLTSYLRLASWWVKYGFHSFMVLWYQSEIQYIDRRLAKIRRELAAHESS